MPYRKRVKVTYRRKPKKANKKHSTLMKMTGGVINKGLEYASSIPGPIGTVARGLNFVKNLINVECKAFDVSGSSTVNNVATSYSATLNIVAKGTADNERIGNSILGNKFMLRYQIFQGAVGRNQTVRMALVYDKKPEVGGLTYQTVFGSNDVNAYNDKDNSDRYVKLMDIRETATDNRPVINKQRIINLTRIHTIFEDDGSFEKGAIILVACSDDGTNPPTLKVTSRYCFYDN